MVAFHEFFTSLSASFKIWFIAFFDSITIIFHHTVNDGFLIILGELNFVDYLTFKCQDCSRSAKIDLELYVYSCRKVYIYIHEALLAPLFL